MPRDFGADTVKLDILTETDALKIYNIFSGMDLPFLERKKDLWKRMDNLKNYKSFRNEDYG